jgi:hypothetical protein
MKKLLLYSAIFLTLSSCNDKSDEYYYLTFIKAGQVSGTGIMYVDIIPDDTIDIPLYPAILKTTNIDYDTTISASYTNSWDTSRNLDLNNDNINDFELILTRSDPNILGSRSSQLVIKPLEMNSVCVSKTKNNWVDSLKYNDTINNNNNWSDSTALLFFHSWTMNGLETYYTTEGYWYNHDNIYIGVKIVKNNNQLFGWIDLKKNIIRQFGITIPYQE